MPRRTAPLALVATLLLAAVPLSGARAQSNADTDRLTVQPRPVEDLKAVFATVESVHETLARTRIGGTIADLKAKAEARALKKAEREAKKAAKSGKKVGKSDKPKKKVLEAA